jgi:HK97 family phage major capsid protein
MKRIKDLREKRANCVKWARARNEQAEQESNAGRAAELRAEADRALDAAMDLKAEIDREERLLEAERDAIEGRTEPRPNPNPDADPTDPERRDSQDLDAVERRIVERIQARGWSVLQGSRENRYAGYDAAAEQRTGSHRQYATAEYRAAFGAAIVRGTPIPAEARALQADDYVSGGALVAPVQFQRDLIQAVDDAVFMRQFGTVRTVRGAQSLGFPSLDADPADGDWTSELATGSEDSSMVFGGRELTPHPLAKRLKVSAKLLRIDPAAEALVRERLAYKFAITMEKAGLTGHGAGQPLGIFTASANGISTGRDVTAGTTTLPTANGLKDVKYSIKGNYWPRCRWMFHRTVVKEIAKLVDGNGRYLWEDQIRMGEPDRLLGFPVSMSEYVPNTLTTGLYYGILGDLSFYWWADALGMTLQRLAELYAETNQIGFIGRLESDGMPVLEEAFARAKLA